MEKKMTKNLSPHQIAKICKRERINLKEFFKRNFEETFGDSPEEKNKIEEEENEEKEKEFERNFF